MQIQRIQHGIAMNVRKNMGQVDFIDIGHAQSIDLGSADNEKPLSLRGLLASLLDAVNGDRALDSKVLLTGKNHRGSARQKPTDRIVSFPAHQQRVAHRDAFESHQIAPQFPWQSVFDPDGSIASHSDNQAHAYRILFQSLRIRTRVI